MFTSIIAKPASDDFGVATVVEYALLLAVGLAAFLALFLACSAFSANARTDAESLAAYSIAGSISASVAEASGDGSTSVTMALDLPDEACGIPYVAYPSPDQKFICVSLAGRNSAAQRAPLLLRVAGVRVGGFIVSPPGRHLVRYDAVDRTVMVT